MEDASVAVLAALNRAMQAHPTQRAAQVIVNALGESPYYMSDEDVIGCFEAYAAGIYSWPSAG